MTHGRINRRLEELRQALASFVNLYNEHWRVERLGFLTPREAREQYEREMAA